MNQQTVITGDVATVALVAYALTLGFAYAVIRLVLTGKGIGFERKAQDVQPEDTSTMRN